MLPRFHKLKITLCQSMPSSCQIPESKVQPCALLGPVRSPTPTLTEERRRRVEGIRLNRPGQKRLLSPELVREGRQAAFSSGQ